MKRANLAALDEIEHAKTAFTVASSFHHDPNLNVKPHGFGKPHSIEVNGDLKAVCLAAAREGCVEETLSVFEASLPLLPFILRFGRVGCFLNPSLAL